MEEERWQMTKSSADQTVVKLYSSQQRTSLPHCQIHEIFGFPTHERMAFRREDVSHEVAWSRGVKGGGEFADPFVHR